MWYRIYNLDGAIRGYIWTINVELGMKRARIICIINLLLHHDVLHCVDNLVRTWTWTRF